MFETLSGGSETARITHVRSEYEFVLFFQDSTNNVMAQKVTRICELAFNNLRRGDTVQKLYDDVRRMKKTSEELREMLNPVKLRPMIFRTRCDLCPA